MEMKDEIRLEATREAVWEALNNPDVLKACIPGCETLEKVSDTEFVSLVMAKVGPIKAKFSGKVTLADIIPLVSYRLVGEGQGGVAGFAKSDITVELVPESTAVTVLRYGVSANIGGKIAQLGTRLIDSTARKMADQFFASFSAAVCEPKEAGEPVLSSDMNAVGAVGAAVAHGDIVVSLVDVVEEAGFEWVAGANRVAGTDRGFGRNLARLLGFASAGKPNNSPEPKRIARHRAAVVTLNRPGQRNAVSLAMWRDLAAIFNRLGRDPEVRAIILTGAHGNFSAGADISEFSTVRATVEQSVEYEVAVDQCCDAIASTPKPTIAVIEGYCLGGACHLAMSCDFRIAHPDAQFAIPAARLSIVYGLRATQRLLALVGLANAKRILYSARKFGTAEAQCMGFADQATEPMRAAKSCAAVMADNAPLTIDGTKVLLHGLTMSLGTLNADLVDQVIERAVGSDDYRDATRAFIEKRQPIFLGK